MKMLKNFRTYNLARSLYDGVKDLKTTGEIRHQIERAALSVVLNLGEGSARPTKKDRHRLYQIALGSLREVQILLDILAAKELAELADRTAASLYRLLHPNPRPKYPVSRIPEPGNRFPVAGRRCPGTKPPRISP